MLIEGGLSSELQEVRPSAAFRWMTMLAGFASDHMSVRPLLKLHTRIRPSNHLTKHLRQKRIELRPRVP